MQSPLFACVLLDSDAKLFQTAMVVVPYQWKTEKFVQNFWRKKKSWTDWKKRWFLCILWFLGWFPLSNRILFSLFKIYFLLNNARFAVFIISYGCVVYYLTNTYFEQLCMLVSRFIAKEIFLERKESTAKRRMKNTPRKRMSRITVNKSNSIIGCCQEKE